MNKGYSWKEQTRVLTLSSPAGWLTSESTSCSLSQESPRTQTHTCFQTGKLFKSHSGRPCYLNYLSHQDVYITRYQSARETLLQRGTVININYHAALSTEDRLVSQLLAQGRGFLLSSLKSYRIATSQKGKEGMKERITLIIFTLKISPWYFRSYSNPNCAKCFGNYLSCCLPSTQLVCWMPSARLLWSTILMLPSAVLTFPNSQKPTGSVQHGLITTQASVLTYFCI